MEKFHVKITVNFGPEYGVQLKHKVIIYSGRRCRKENPRESFLYDSNILFPAIWIP
jgi:hypothetical protein